MNHCTLYSQCSYTAPGFVFPPRYMEIDGRSDQRLLNMAHISLLRSSMVGAYAFLFHPDSCLYVMGTLSELQYLMLCDVISCYVFIVAYLYLLDLLAYTLYII